MHYQAHPTCHNALDRKVMARWQRQWVTVNLFGMLFVSGVAKNITNDLSLRFSANGLNGMPDSDANSLM